MAYVIKFYNNDFNLIFTFYSLKLYLYVYAPRNHWLYNNKYILRFKFQRNRFDEG